MSIALYSKYRRQNLRNAWQLADMNGYVRRWMREVGKWLFLFLAALAFLAWADERVEAQERIEQAARKVDRLERVIVSCLENRGFMSNGELHLCEITNTRIRS